MLFIKAVAALALAQIALAAPHHSKGHNSVSKSHGHTKHNTHHVVHHKKAARHTTKKATKHTTKKPVKHTTKKTVKHTTKKTVSAQKKISNKDIVHSTSLSDGSQSDFAQAALDVHNKYRATHHASPLKWSAKLANDAMNVAKTCIFEHKIVDNEGQCLAMGYPSIEAAIKGWYDEESKYNYNAPGFSMATGHFTQVVWKGTTEVGCAAYDCPNNGGNYIVCNYNPSGNYLGEFPKNVQAP
ncbi:CAP domain-containing protein [Choanephora cucurbitarum]|nr:CAP domain-containing protein [Choanephora cucurbitarum]